MRRSGLSRACAAVSGAGGFVGTYALTRGARPPETGTRVLGRCGLPVKARSRRRPWRPSFGLPGRSRLTAGVPRPVPAGEGEPGGERRE